MTNQHHVTMCHIHEAICQWTIKSFDLFFGELISPHFFAPTAGDIKFHVVLKQNKTSDSTIFTINKQNFILSLYLSSEREFTNIYAIFTCSILESGDVLEHILHNRSVLFNKPNQLSLVWDTIPYPKLKSNNLNLLFTINFYIGECGETTCFSYPLKEENNLSLDKLIDDLNCLNSDALLADIIILVEGKEFPAHKAILAARSPILREIFSTTSSNNASGIMHINIDNTKARTWKVLQHFIYTGKLDLTLPEITSNCTKNSEHTNEDKEEINCENEDLRFNKNIDQCCELDIDELVALADEYGLQSAINELEIKMSQTLNDENLPEYLRCAIKHKLTKLETVCIKLFHCYDIKKKKELFSSSKWKEMGSEFPEILMKCLESSLP